MEEETHTNTHIHSQHDSHTAASYKNNSNNKEQTTTTTILKIPKLTVRILDKHEHLYIRLKH